MSGRTRRVDCHERRLLSEGWAWCRTEPNSVLEPEQLTGRSWQSMAHCTTVAAAERAAATWSLEQAPTRFDASDWWYRVRFDVPGHAATDDLVLGFDGLATLAHVWLNGAPLFESQNMFVASEHAVGARLVAHGNELLIRFAALDTALAARRPRPRWRAPMIEHQQLRWYRTTPLGRTPGWSPPCAVVGPWRDIWLENRHGLWVGPPRLQARLDGADGVLEVACDFGATSGIRSVQVELHRNAERTRSPLARSPAQAGQWSGTHRVPDVARWWPHTHGEPALYDVRVHVQRDGAGEVELDLGAVGFRTLEVHTEDGGFGVRVNGAAVFCRGACWTPMDPVTLRGTPQAYERAVAQVRRAGMNMLRVGGTMVYEDDAFVQACDEHGVLIWQDFMFANMDFPLSDAAFAHSVRTEVAQQLDRWQAHPAVAVLCGNSEVAQQAAMWGATREHWAPALFHELIPSLVQQHMPGAAYWPSSAWGGAVPHQVDTGTTSYYGVGAYLREAADARRSGLRFATEALAYANVPETPTIARMPGGHGLRVTHAAWKARAPRDLGAGWDFEDVRDHYLQALFGVDPARLRYDDHERYLLLSRLTSAECMVGAYSEWRRHGSRCQGALVWFLRDLWAGAGWGVLDDAGRPKACWHALARTLQPRTVLLTDEGNNGVVAHVVNEASEPLQARLDVACWRRDVATARSGTTVTVPARSVQAVPVLSMMDHFADLNHAFRFGPLNHDAVVATLRDDAGTRIAQAFYFPGGLGLSREQDVGLSADATALDGGAVRVRLRSRQLALGVHFDAPGYGADQEYFHAVADDEYVVTFEPLGASPRPWHGTVSAVNALAPTTIRASV